MIAVEFLAVKSRSGRGVDVAVLSIVECWGKLLREIAEESCRTSGRSFFLYRSLAGRKWALDQKKEGAERIDSRKVAAACAYCNGENP